MTHVFEIGGTLCLLEDDDAEADEEAELGTVLTLEDDAKL